jgi:hypothetical protein
MNTIAHDLFYELVWAYAEYTEGCTSESDFLDMCETLLGPYVGEMGASVYEDRDERG